MKYSHNDQWTKQPLTDALLSGFSAVEVDIIYNGDVYCQHSWRPFPCMTYGSLLEKYIKPLIKINTQFFLILEFKTGGEKIINRLWKVIQPILKKENIIILLDACDNWLQKNRVDTMFKFYKKYPHPNIRLKQEFKDLEAIRLYKKSIWHF